VVPKALWSRLTESDELNRIPLVIRPMLIQAGDRWILVETGLDVKPGEKHQKIYRIEQSHGLFAALRNLGLSPEDIDLVINTHLHFDHAGWNTRLVDGRLEPTFKKARYLVQRQELYEALNPHERNRGSYLPENVEPLVDRGLFEEVEGQVEVLPGLEVLPLPGHTLGQQGVVLTSEGKRLVYTADLLPTFNHVGLPYIMAYDLYPVTTLETRRRRYPEWAEVGALLVTPHDPSRPFARLRAGPKGWEAY
jgi:glyoxylase-like metal-dependent hydrolase (beta-lactamase superfamily II)